MDRVCSRFFLVNQDAADYEDYEWAFGLNRFTLELFGVWPSDGRDHHDQSDLKYLRTPLIVMWMLFGMFLPQMYALSLVFRELPLLMDNVTTSVATLTASTKLFLLWNNQQVLEPLQRWVLCDWERSKSPWEHGVMVKQAKRARILTLSGYGLTVFAICGFLAMPIFGFSIRIVNNVTDPYAKDGRYFPLQTYYPYNFATSPYFELIYVTQMIAGSFVGFSFSVPDTFFGALVFHVSGQCEILGARMSDLLPRDADEFVKWMKDGKRYFRLELQQLIETHVHLIKFVDAVENSFNLLILAQVVSLSLSICCLGFGVIKSIGTGAERPPVIQIVTLTGTLMDLLIHMLVYCIASEILSKHSLDFFHAVYCSDWYLLPAKYARDIIPIMVRSQFPLQLSAGKFMYLSLNTYLNILKTYVGYISMLLTVSN